MNGQSGQSGQSGQGEKAKVKGVLVTGTGAPPGLGVLRSLQDSGRDLILVAGDADPYAAGLHGQDCPGVVLPRADKAEVYRRAIRQVCEAYGLDVVLPCSEAETAVLAPVREEFERRGIRIPVSNPEVIAFGVDKAKLLKQAIQHALPTPKTLFAECSADLAAWDGGYPCVVKPTGSRGARGVSYPASLEDLRETWPRTVSAHGPCIVQQFIPGGPETIYTIGALFDHGRLILSTLHRKLATNPPTGGAAIAGETVADPVLRDAGLAVFDATGPWHGLAAVELKRPAPDQPAYLLEINPRMWGFGYLMTMAGLNVPERLIAMLQGEEITLDEPPYRAQRMVRAWRDVPLDRPAQTYPKREAPAKKPQNDGAGN